MGWSTLFCWKVMRTRDKMSESCNCSVSSTHYWSKTRKLVVEISRSRFISFLLVLENPQVASYVSLSSLSRFLGTATAYSGDAWNSEKTSGGWKHGRTEDEKIEFKKVEEQRKASEEYFCVPCLPLIAEIFDCGAKSEFGTDRMDSGLRHSSLPRQRLQG